VAAPIIRRDRQQGRSRAVAPLGQLMRERWHAAAPSSLSLHRSGGNATNKHFELARWTKLSRQPSELSLYRCHMRIAQ
jgi:hypothetical protein